jgi:hypothetical protein
MVYIKLKHQHFSFCIEAENVKCAREQTGPGITLVDLVNIEESKENEVVEQQSVEA